MYNSILLPIAPGDAAQSSQAVSAARLMLAEGGTLSVLTVLEVPPVYLAGYLPERMADEVIEAEQKRQAGEIRDLTGIEATVVNGHAARKILDEAERLDADCIVMSSHRPGPQDFFIGSTTARVVRRAKCTVLIVR